ncbi:hypothetical protein [Kiritimatiella glycovorans]|uniref:Uncharacterized protein n=1 Tax=Kiritimatiella glycovorans TaxID=1307763 RepID=A0A0G3EFR0_9BACT|nr:hypothetical protein [Kiritimatiella glycovorans]AKJ65188.1 hypothetical protein L21SP4_01953 [Kiritimatiella glycovorans]
MIRAVVTPATGKRLIARALVRHPAMHTALESGTVVIIAGTTNGYVAEELLSACGDANGFSRQRFFRGITRPPCEKTTDTGRLPGESPFPGDVVIQKGAWLTGKTIFDVLDDLKEGDVILKGANAVDLARKQAGILIGHPKGGTIVAALQAVVGRRVRLILPVGLEKRVSTDLNSIAAHLNAPGTGGARMLPVPGEVVTEIDAIAILTRANAELIAAGGVCGAEGAVWLAISGTAKQEETARSILADLGGEPTFTLE